MNHLETYQNIIVACVVCGIIIVFVGALLTNVLQNHKGGESVKLESTEGNNFYFSSSFAGGVTSLSGAIIVELALFATMFTVPKPDFSKDGWTTTKTSIPFITNAIDSGKMSQVRFKVMNGTEFDTDGFILSGDFSDKLKQLGLPSEKISQDRLDLSKLPIKSKALKTIKDSGKDAYFVPKSAVYHWAGARYNLEDKPKAESDMIRETL